MIINVKITAIRIEIIKINNIIVGLNTKLTGIEFGVFAVLCDDE